jgi:hypothetical protein
MAKADFTPGVGNSGTKVRFLDSGNYALDIVGSVGAGYQDWFHADKVDFLNAQVKFRGKAYQSNKNYIKCYLRAQGIDPAAITAYLVKLFLDPASATLRLFRVIAGTPTQIAADDVTNYPLNTWHSFRVTVQDEPGPPAGVRVVVANYVDPDWVERVNFLDTDVAKIVLPGRLSFGAEISGVAYAIRVDDIELLDLES